MARKPGSQPDGTHHTDTLLAVVTAGDPRGQTAEEIATALHRLGDDRVQQELEELVARGLLERQGVGRGALYTPASL